MFILFMKLCLIKNELGWAGSVYGEGRGVYRVLVGKPRERDHCGDPGIDGSIILRRIYRKWNVGGMDWIELAQNRDRWRALVNAIMKLRVP
jgi:hypothetical protein